MADWTLVEWMVLRPSLWFRSSLMPSGTVFLRSVTNSDTRVFFIRRFATWLMSLWLGWVGRVVEMRNCFDSIVQWSFTFMHLASVSKCSFGVILTQSPEF